jgi:2-polyprenyl-6-methoxyphenol hydroxylase-like FAD-dependent oxidoreductase
MARVTGVGAGGIGCAMAHALAEGGSDATVVESDRARLEWGRANGVAVDESASRSSTRLD